MKVSWDEWQVEQFSHGDRLQRRHLAIMHLPYSFLTVSCCCIDIGAGRSGEEWKDYVQICRIIDQNRQKKDYNAISDYWDGLPVA